MSELSLYRKYRPKDFKEVVGQDHVVSVLEGALKKGAVGHAYLFVGTRGTGKTSVARIFSRNLGCAPEDIYELDAASNNGVDDIRELTEGVHSLPFSSKFKVYILDEVHMLSKSAANAFLKTLEEPPKHVIFILATTDPEKLPETIVSRCQVFTFKKPSEHILKDVVIDIAKKEGIVLEPMGAEIIAIAGDGSFRDTLGILQKVLNYSTDKKISADEIEKVTGAPKSTLVNEYIQGLVLRDAEKCLKVVHKAHDAQVDMKLFLKLVMHTFRQGLLVRFAPTMKKEIETVLSESDKIFLEGIAKEKEGVLASKTLVTMLRVYEEFSDAFIPTLPLEILALKIANREE